MKYGIEGLLKEEMLELNVLFCLLRERANDNYLVTGDYCNFILK